ncbi:MAG: GNAT family N-acetyltransferase [Candidatus Kapaibacterium sp.]|jgi:ElaA protein
MNFVWKKFDELTNYELYEVLKLRSMIFVVEQNCSYLDLDGYDINSLHLLGFKDIILISYLRLLPPGLKYNESSIGRVTTKIDFRGQGLGKQLMIEAINKSKSLYPDKLIKISAQYHLEKFYTSMGFKTNSATYYEDDIAHIEMIL